MLKRLLALFIASVSCVFGQVTVRTNPTSANGCSNNNTQGTSLVVTSQGAHAGDDIIVVATNLNVFPITAASVSGTTATITFGGGTINTPPAAGKHARITQMTTTGYNCNSCTVITSSSTQITYTVGGALTSCASAATCGTTASVGVVPTVTDNGTTPNTYNEVLGAYGADNNIADGVGGFAGGEAVFGAHNITLHTGATQLTVSLNSDSSSFLALCAIAVGGLSGVVDATGITHYPTPVQSSVPTPSIGGNFTPEFIVANSYSGNGSSGNSITACGGHTFTDFNPGSSGDSNNGSPAAFFVTSGTGTFCAGLNFASNLDGVVSIASFKAAATTANGFTPVMR